MEIEKCVWVLKYFAENAEEFLKSEVIKTDYKESYVQYDQIAVILGIMPWNFPYWQVIRFIAPVLMAGNTCIVKHASNVSGGEKQRISIARAIYKKADVLFLDDIVLVKIVMH